jgi:hypothetical protein
VSFVSDGKEVVCREVLTTTFFPFLQIEIDNKMEYLPPMVLIGVKRRAGYTLSYKRHPDHRVEAHQGSGGKWSGLTCKS